MKIYRNRLYSIQDAAKRSGVTEEALKEMITYHVVMAYIKCNIPFIWGKDIGYLKAKWEEWQAKKEKMKKAKMPKVTMLRMDKGE